MSNGLYSTRLGGDSPARGRPLFPNSSLGSEVAQLSSALSRLVWPMRRSLNQSPRHYLVDWFVNYVPKCLRPSDGLRTM